jgi:hypothetical protein
MPHADLTVPSTLATSQIARIRLTLGLLQGVVLYFLYRAAKNQAWPATDALVFAPLLLVALYVPVLMISALGHLSGKTLWRWTLAATLIAAGLGWHDVWRSVGAPASDFGRGLPGAHFPSPLLWVFGAFGLYIAHALILASTADQRRIARYPTYFDIAWKLLIQIQFSGLFVAAFWAVLSLGAALFKLIQLSFLQDLLIEPWFAIPVTVFAFACAMHLTDVRPAIVRGIRSLVLVLLSWILPVAVLIVGGFLLSLPFTGLAQLWATRHAAALLLSAAAALVILVNAAFQNGGVANEVAGILRVSAKLASLLLLPLVLIASYALGLRVVEYGWTTDRIIAAGCLLVAGCYALGYGWAASRRSGWLDAVAPVNIAVAFVVLALLLALFTPVLDPARVSVASQLSRLNSGRQSAETFDFDYLKFEGKRYGLAALERLKIRAEGADAATMREKATLTLAKKNQWEKSLPHLPASDVRANLKIWPPGGALPDSFLAQDWSKDGNPWRVPNCLKTRGSMCDVYAIAFDTDAQDALLVISQASGGNQSTVFALAQDAHWQLVATLPPDFAKCAVFRDKLQAGEFSMVAARQKDLEIAGQRIRLTPTDSPKISCNTTK